MAEDPPPASPKKETTEEGGGEPEEPLIEEVKDTEREAKAIGGQLIAISFGEECHFELSTLCLLSSSSHDRDDTAADEAPGVVVQEAEVEAVVPGKDETEAKEPLADDENSGTFSVSLVL